MFRTGLLSWQYGAVPKIVVITGLSGAGRSVAAGALEDAGWFAIDNLPGELVPKFAELASGGSQEYDRIALVVRGYDAQVADAVEDLKARFSVVLIFLEASLEVIVRRFELTKRRHPFTDERTLVEAIRHERELMRAGRAAADVVIDTSDLNPHELRERLLWHVDGDESSNAMKLTVQSFGFKHGLPRDVDMVFDCRFLPNPYWDENLRHLNGLDQPIAEYVLDRPEAQRFVDKVQSMLADLVPSFQEGGRSYLSVAFGCTGGHHRSVAVAEQIGKALVENGWEPRVFHRDIER